MIDVFFKFDLSVEWSSGIRYINFLYSSRVEARTLPCTFIALPRFKFLYIGNGNKVFILGVSWYQSNAFTFLSSCEIVIEYLSIYRSPKFQLESRKRGLNRIKIFVHSIQFLDSLLEKPRMRNPPRPDPIRSKRRSKDAALSWLRSTSIDRFAPHPHDPISMLHDDVAHEALPYTTARRAHGLWAGWPQRKPLGSLARTRSARFCALAAENITSRRVFGLAGGTARRVPFFHSLPLSRARTGKKEKLLSRQTRR